jgi:hypothetical protein
MCSERFYVQVRFGDEFPFGGEDSVRRNPLKSKEKFSF